MGMAGNMDADTQIQGGTDLTIIGNVGDKLKVTTSGDVTSVPYISSKMKVDPRFTPITIVSGGGYTTVYTYTGTGYLLGFNLEFNNTDCIVKLVMDGDTIMDGNSIATLNGLLVTANSTDRRQAGTGVITSSATIDFSFRQPIKFNTSFTISAATGATSRTFNQGMIYVVKDT